jgi:hypothetical protein
MNQCFVETITSTFRGRKSAEQETSVEVIRSYETLVYIWTTRRYITEMTASIIIVVRTLNPTSCKKLLLYEGEQRLSLFLPRR